MNRLSVFAGGCDLQAAESVLGGDDLDALDVVDDVGALGRQVAGRSPTPTRPVTCAIGCWRRSASTPRNDSKLSGEAPTIRRRHADHFVSVAETAGPGLRSREQLAWAQRSRCETDNLRAALDWAVETPSADHALRLVAPLMVHGIAIGYSALTWAETAVEISRRPRSSVVSRRGVVGDLVRHRAGRPRLGRPVRGHDRRRRGPTRSRQRDRRVVARPSWRSFAATVHRARSKCEEWVARSRRSDDDYELSQALIRLAVVQGGHR